MKNKIIFCLVFVCIILIGGCGYSKYNQDVQIEEEINGKGIGLADPSAVYCHELGYELRASESQGLCVFPDNSSCSTWNFYGGLCGQEWSYCKQQGYDIKVKDDGKDPYSPYAYSVCIDKNTRKEIGSVVKLTHLEEKITKNTK